MDPVVNDAPRWTPGVTLLQAPVMFLFADQRERHVVVTNGICRVSAPWTS